MKPPSTRLRRLTQGLPRDTRDTLWLVAVVGFAVLPQLPRLPLWAVGVVLGLLAWRAALAVWERPLPPRGLLVALLLGVAALTRWEYGVLIGRASGLTLLCVLLGMKLLEMRARRDAFVVFFLGFFLILLQYLHSQSLWVALWSGLTVWALLTSVVLAHMPLGQPALRLAAREAGRSVLLGLPVMALLFVAFPRLDPLWGVPSQGASTGLSDRLGFGDIAQLAQNERLALRLQALPGSSLPAPSQLYVRAHVLSQFDGQEWQGAPAPRRRAPPELLLQGEVVRYQAVLEPQHLSVLPVLEPSPGQAGESWEPNPGLRLQRSAEWVWHSPRPLSTRLAFEHVALRRASDAQMGPTDWDAALASYLQLPAAFNPRLRAWSRQQAGPGDARDGARTQDFVRLLLRHIQQSPFHYSLTPGAYGLDSPHGVDEFWFDRRVGFCEHYAGATALALRAAGVPSRIVTGYLGADPEPLEGWTLIRSSHAHAWVEYWLAGAGWQRLDPTGAVAPERVLRNQVLLAPPGVLRGAMNALDPALWQHLRQWAERLDLQWQQRILNYQRAQQLNLLKHLGLDEPDTQQLGGLAAVGIGLLLGLGLLLAAWQNRSPNPWTRRLAAVRRRLQARGLPAAPFEAPLRWAERCPDAALRDALLALEQLRYGQAATAQAPRGWAGVQSRLQETRAWWRWWRTFRRLT